MIKTKLLEIGLSEKEADLYLIILKHKQTTAGQISRIQEESRTHTYDTLVKLLKKGLINYVIKNNVRYFQAVDPEKLIDYLKEKQAKLKEEEQEILQIIPELKKLQVPEKEEVKIEVYEGKEGIKTIMNSILRERKDVITWGASANVSKYLPDFFIRRYLNERKKYKIRAKQLFTDFYGVLKSPLSENRKLPKEFASPTTTSVYGDKVAIFMYFEIPRTILIQNKELANSYKKYFELMWNASKS
jgi:sugar-specific transcriptional regulator TrmB